MYALSAIIDNLDTDLLPALLEKNARSHKPRKIPPEAFDVSLPKSISKLLLTTFLFQNLIAAVLEVFKKAYPKEFIEEAEKAWAHVLQVAFKVIKDKLKSA